MRNPTIRNAYGQNFLPLVIGGLIGAVLLVVVLNFVVNRNVVHGHPKSMLLSGEQARQLMSEYREKDGLEGLAQITDAVNRAIKSAARRGEFETYVDITEYEANVQLFFLDRLKDKGFRAFTKTITSTGAYTTRVEIVLVVNWEKQ